MRAGFSKCYAAPKTKEGLSAVIAEIVSDYEEIR
jgi:hypothetical protein